MLTQLSFPKLGTQSQIDKWTEADGKSHKAF